MSSLFHSGMKGVFLVAACALLSANGDGLKAIETVPHELDVLVEAGHVQGVCCSEKAIYLTHARGIEKLDWSGRLLKHADAPAHLGDCCYHDGHIYGAFVLQGAKVEGGGDRLSRRWLALVAWRLLGRDKVGRRRARRPSPQFLVFADGRDARRPRLVFASMRNKMENVGTDYP